MDVLTKIENVLERDDNFLVISHLDPDGDAIGSMFGMGYILKYLNKKFSIFIPSGIPEKFAWLPSPGGIISHLKGDRYDWVIFLDCSNKSRVGDSLELLSSQAKIINIDHHADNTFFGDINWVDTNKSSVGEMVGVIAQRFNVSFKGGLAEPLFLAIVSDTGSFSYGNTSASCLRFAAEILEEGLDLNKFTANFSRQWSINKAHLHGFALVNSKLELGGKVGVIKVSQSMLDAANAKVEDCEGLVNYMRQIRGVLVAVSIREERDRIKFSLRSWGEVDVQKIASKLGGGGHPNAAGGSLNCSLNEAEQIILKTIERYL